MQGDDVLQKNAKALFPWLHTLPSRPLRPTSALATGHVFKLAMAQISAKRPGVKYFQVGRRASILLKAHQIVPRKVIKIDPNYDAYLLVSTKETRWPSSAGQ